MNRLRSLLVATAVVGAGAALPSTVSARPSKTAAPKPCTDSSRACVIEAANTYLKALISHDATQIRLAPNARRTENGMATGDNAAAIRKSLTPPTPDQSNVAMRQKRWWVEGENAICYYLLDTSTIPPTPLHTTTTHIAERFRVRNGLIYEIEAIFWASPGSTPEGSGW
jgi:hypothetical protein